MQRGFTPPLVVPPTGESDCTPIKSGQIPPVLQPHLSGATGMLPMIEKDPRMRTGMC
jgi:hypothetical protein